MYSVAFILALLAFGGLAAYLGDLLGYRLGKRRLSLLHLRPRTTARLVAVVVGVLIPLVTVGITSLLVPQVRDAVFRIDDLHREIGNLQTQRDTAATERDSARMEAGKQQRAGDHARADANTSRTDLAAVRQILGKARASLSSARNRVAALRGQTQRLSRERNAASKSLSEAEKALKDAEAALKDAEVGLADALKSVDVAESEKQRLQEEVKALTDQLTLVKQEWEIQHTIFSLRQPILDADTELVRGVIHRPETVDELTDEIVALLVLADTVAERAGAGPTGKGRFTRAVLPVATGRTWEPGEYPPEEMVLGEVRRQLWASPADENVLQIKVVGRAAKGEVVNVRFEARANKLVFRQGETIVTREFGPGLAEADALESIWLLIADPKQSEVRRQAIAAGLLPDPDTGGYGAVTIRDLYAAAKACAGRDQPVKVKVQAAEDAYTEGPLRIKIVVEPAGGE